MINKLLNIILFLTLSLSIKVDAEVVSYENLMYKNFLYFHKSDKRPFTGHTSGKVRAKIVNGVYDGNYEQFFQNGQLRLKGLFHKGKKNGVWISFHKNGQLHSKGKYKNGKLVGLWIDFYENGEERSSIIFSED